jgi:hypothetical protein
MRLKDLSTGDGDGGRPTRPMLWTVTVVRVMSGIRHYSPAFLAARTSINTDALPNSIDSLHRQRPAIS